MRLFIAAGISDETRAALGGIRASIEQALAGATVPPRITWVRAAAAHVTLRFIGEVSDGIAAAIEAAFTPPMAVPPFDIDWDSVGVFPAGRAGERSPRTIWMGTSPAGAHALNALVQAVAARVEPIVGVATGRPFSAHLTVGRVRLPGRGVHWPAVLADAQPPATRSHIDRVTLYRSELSSRGPTYTALCESALVA